MPPFLEKDLNPASLVNAAAEISRMRRQREKCVPTSLLGEPAWDILLAMFIDQDADLTVTSVCHAGNVPQTTGLRWVSHLESKGYIYRRPATGDKRSSYLTLTQEGRAMMEQVLRLMLREQ